MPFIFFEFHSYNKSTCIWECPCPKSKHPVTLFWQELITLLMAAYFMYLLRVSHSLFCLLRPTGLQGPFYLTETFICAQEEKQSCQFLWSKHRKWHKRWHIKANSCECLISRSATSKTKCFSYLKSWRQRRVRWIISHIKFLLVVWIFQTYTDQREYRLSSEIFLKLIFSLS